MVDVIAVIAEDIGGTPTEYKARRMNYAGGERLQGTIETLVQDTTPELGGDLDLAGFDIVDGAQELFSWDGVDLYVLGEPLIDVDIVAGVQDGHVLIYDSVSSEFQNSFLQAFEVEYDDTTTTIGAADVQEAIEYLVANGGGGGGGITSVFADKTPTLGGSLELGAVAESSRSFLDHNGNQMIGWGPATSAVNYLQISNAATGNAATLRAQGTDAIVDLQLLGKGTTCKVIVSCDLQMSGILGNQAIVDSADADLIRFTEVASAVNYLEIFNAVTATASGIRATGADTDVDLSLNTKGNGRIVLGGDIDLAVSNHTVWDRNDNEILVFTEDAASVNHLELGNADTGLKPFIGVHSDSEANTGLDFHTRGTGGFIFRNVDGTDLNKLFRLAGVASGENYIQITQAASGSAPILRSRGDNDANIDLIITGKGTGIVKIGAIEASISRECEVFAVTGTALTTTEITIPLSTISQVTSAGFTLDTGNDDVAVGADGFYEIVGYMSIDRATSGAGWAELKIQDDSGGTFADTDDSWRTDTAGNAYGYVTARTMVNLSNGDKVRLRGVSSHATLETVRACHLYIRRVSAQI